MSDVRKKLNALISGGETSEVEFKSARGGLPASLWASYSAFANTNGGTIVLGVQEKNGRLALDGLTEEAVTRYKKNFWDCVHNKGKVSVCLPREEDVRVEEVDGSYVLLCEIPRAGYDLRPVYITTNPFGNTYRRNHEGDYLCTDAEVRRMFADADHDRHPQDGRILAGYRLERDIDIETLRQYRQTFASLQPTHPWVGLDDMDFLKKIGAYTTEYETGKEGFTLAGVLMFGKYDSIINNSGDPMYFVDYRERIGTDNPRMRWTNRIYPDGTWEANLYQFYVRVYNRLIQVLPRPFMQKEDLRLEETPAHDAVREALINCIIHQDLNAVGNIVVVRTDGAIVFKNPGMMLVSKQQYFEGGHSVCRNPILQKMFMRLGRAEKAGSGVDKIVNGWKYLGWTVPTVEEATRPDYVVLTMPVENEVEKTVQENRTRKSINNVLQDVDVEYNTRKPYKKTRQEDRIRKPYKKTVQENPTRRPDKKDLRMREILVFCSEPRSLSEILSFLGLKHRGNLMSIYIGPMIKEGMLAMTDPENPTSRKQQYVSVGQPGQGFEK